MRHSILDKAKELARRALATARRLGADGAAISIRQGESQSCSFQSGRLKGAGSDQSISMGAAVLVGKRRGQAGGNDLEEIDDIVARAVGLAKAGSEAHFDAYPAPLPVRAVKTHSPRTLELSRDRMIESCSSIVEALKAYDEHLFIEADASRGETERVLATSGGVLHEQTSTRWSLSGGVQRTEGTDMLFAGEGASWRDLNEFFDSNYIARRILEDLRWGERIAAPPSGKVPAFLPPEMLDQLLSLVALGLSGRNVAKGDSPLRGRLGEQVLHPCLTVVDNPHHDFATGAAAMDDDGVPTRRLTLFDHGVLRNYIYDLDSAGLAGAAPTGNRRCQPYRIEVTPGEIDSQAILANIDDGIYIRGLLGFGQSNVMNGDFSCNVSLGFRIEKGEITGRLKNTMISGNVYDLLSHGVSLSRDRDERIGVPYARIEGVSVSGAT